MPRIPSPASGCSSPSSIGGGAFESEQASLVTISGGARAAVEGVPTTRTSNRRPNNSATTSSRGSFLAPRAASSPGVLNATSGFGSGISARAAEGVVAYADQLQLHEPVARAKQERPSWIDAYDVGVMGKRTHAQAFGAEHGVADDASQMWAGARPPHGVVLPGIESRPSDPRRQMSGDLRCGVTEALVIAGLIDGAEMPWLGDIRDAVGLPRAFRGSPFVDTMRPAPAPAPFTERDAKRGVLPQVLADIAAMYPRLPAEENNNSAYARRLHELNARGEALADGKWLDIDKLASLSGAPTRLLAFDPKLQELPAELIPIALAHPRHPEEVGKDTAYARRLHGLSQAGVGTAQVGKRRLTLRQLALLSGAPERNLNRNPEFKLLPEELVPIAIAHPRQRDEKNLDYARRLRGLSQYDGTAQLDGRPLTNTQLSLISCALADSLKR